MAAEKIKAELRTEFGKGAARRIRRADKVPAVVYGHGNDPVHLTLPGHDTMMALKHGGANALLELDIDGEEHLALTKQVQVDPIRRVLEHIDFVAVRRGEKVTVEIRVVLVGEAVREALVVTEQTTIQVEAEATHIPESIEIDIEGAGVGTQIHASDLVLPERHHAVARPGGSGRQHHQRADRGGARGRSRRRGRRGRGRRGRGPGRRGRGRVRRGRRGRRGVILTRLGTLVARVLGRGQRDDAAPAPMATSSDTSDAWLVVGLGNPGPAYAGHRHNVGYLVVDELAARMGSSLRAHKSGRAEVVEGRLGAPGPDAPRVVLVRARCYMNESGGPVKALATFYKVAHDHVVAVHDELDLDVRQAAGQAGGRRQRPQRPAFDALVARHR